MKFLLKIIRIVFVVFSVSFGYLTITRNQFHYLTGTYFDEKSLVVYNEDALLVYFIFAIISILMVIILSVYLCKK